MSRARSCAKHSRRAPALSRPRRDVSRNGGFIRQVAVAGERSHFFRADDDVWASFLAHENKEYRRARDLAQSVLTRLSNADEHPRIRFQNMRDYHEWLEADHQDLLTRWEG